MSILVIASIVGGLVVAGSVLMGVRKKRAQHRRAVAPGQQLREPALNPPKAPSFEALGLRLGDVVLIGDTEAWLTGALHLQEAGACVACIFFTDRGSAGDVLLGCAGPTVALFQCKPTPHPDLDLAPHTIEHERDLYTRSRRVPVVITAHGEGAPALAGEGLMLWFESSIGTSLVVLQSDGRAWAWVGAAVDPSTTLRLAAGEATFRI